MTRILRVLVLSLGLALLAIPGGARAEVANEFAAPVQDAGATLDALIAAIDVVDTPVIAVRTADVVLLDGYTAGVLADTGVMTADGFTAQLNLRDDMGILVATEYAAVARNGNVSFTTSPTNLLMPSTAFTLEVLRFDPDTSAVSVVSALNLAPLVLNCSTDSVSQTVARAAAAGDISTLTNMLAIGAETGGLTAAETALLQAAVARIGLTAAGAAARQTALSLAQRAVQYALSNVPRGSAAFNTARASITNAFFKYGYQPSVNAFSIAIMRDYISKALDNIKKYQDLMAQSPNAPATTVAVWQRQIDLQNARISQIMTWFQANGVNP